MNYYQARVNRVIDYIAENLHDELPLAQLAKVACFSEFHFHRIFRSLVGETVGEFITRLRLEKAVFLMKHNKSFSLTRIAAECGFDSASGFSRGFKKKYGVSPRGFDFARFHENSKIGQALPFQSKYYLNDAQPWEGSTFEVKVKDLPELHLAYVRIFGGYLHPDAFVRAYELLMNWARAGGVLTPQSRLIGMSQDDPEITPLEKCRYDFCFTVPHGVKPEGEIGFTTVPRLRYAVLHCEGDAYKVDEAWNYLFKVWLPSSRFEPVHHPALEIYLERPEDLIWERFNIECCVPVKLL